MPVCFALIKKSDLKQDPQAIPTNLADLDAEMRQHFGEPADDTHWLYNWYDTIGMLLAVGRRWDNLRDIFKDSPKALKVIDYLEERYTVQSWREYK